jgi:serine/threonine-protein kinase
MQEAEVANGRYRSILRLGAGGMAYVDLALQTGLGDFKKLSVLKRLRPELSKDTRFGAMFLDEAKLAARLNHPNVIHSYEAATDATGAYLAMEYLHGQTYASLLARFEHNRADVIHSIVVLIATLSALEYAHEFRDVDGRLVHIVHRDVSPHNIFITYDGQIKLLDFGIAKVLGSIAETRVGALKGKIRYIAPEQVHGKTADGRADLYAVGVMLWEAAAGRRRFGSLPEADVVQSLASGAPPTPPGAEERGLPASLDAICVKALAAEPEDRFRTATEFREALENVLKELGESASARAVGRRVRQLFDGEARAREALIERELKLAASSDNKKETTVAPVSVPTPKSLKALPSIAALVTGCAIAATALIVTQTPESADTSPANNKTASAAQTTQQRAQPKTLQSAEPPAVPLVNEPKAPTPTTPELGKPAPPQEAAVQREELRPTRDEAARNIPPVPLAPRATVRRNVAPKGFGDDEFGPVPRKAATLAKPQAGNTPIASTSPAVKLEQRSSTATPRRMPKARGLHIDQENPWK